MTADFAIKLLSGQSLIMVEIVGHDSEIFSPQIVNGRITLCNVVLNRRCCSFGGGHEPKVKRKPLQAINSVNIPTRVQSFKKSLSISNTPPAANSTPTCRKVSLPTPEIARRAAVPQHGMIATPRLGAGIKVVRLHRNPSVGTPQNVAKVVSRLSHLSPIANNMSNGTLRSPLRNLILSDIQIHPPSFNASISPLRSFVLRQQQARTPPVPGTPSQWRKCITPKRTYSRRPLSARKLSAKRVVSKTPRLKNGARMPDFLRNPTKGIKPVEPIEVEKRRFVVDDKVAISPKSFRLQVQDTNDLYRSEFYLPRTRADLRRQQFSAFDLVTQPNRDTCLTLKFLFWNGCRRKSAPLFGRYQSLIENIPELEEEERVINRKRLEFGAD